MPADHPWTAKETIDAEMLNDKSLLLLGEGHCFRDQVLEACPTTRKGEAPSHTTVESSLLETIRHMVASGLGVSILPLSAVDSHHYAPGVRSEEHTSELQSLMRISYAVFCLKKNTNTHTTLTATNTT